MIQAAVLFLAVISVGTAAASSEDGARDLRGHELVRFDCASGELSRNVSLFANGTVRIRDLGNQDAGLRLAELAPEELTAFATRLAQIDLTRVASQIRGPSGESIEQCLLRLELDGRAREEYRFLRLAALPLELSRVLTVVDDIVEVAEERDRLSSGLPGGYTPRSGDVLVRRDGSRHRVVRITADGGGAEIIALDAPLVVYLTLEAVRSEFVAIEPGRGRQ